MQRRTPTRIRLKYGPEILGDQAVKSMDDFVGQAEARMELMSEIIAARKQGRPVDHILLASGMPGIGKTTLARLTAHLMGGGLAELAGSNVSAEDGVRAVQSMSDGDVLFMDEIHLLVAGGRNKADWLLTLLQEGMIQTRHGAVQAPKITVIAATTDAQQLPRTILDRFPVQPLLNEYTTAEAAQLAQLTAKHLGFGTVAPAVTDETWFWEVATAADRNPRTIGRLLKSVLRAGESPRGAFDGTRYDLTQALEWAGLTTDGLTRGQVSYLRRLYILNGTASQATLKAAMSEMDIKHDEHGLIRRGYVEVGPGGRSLTEWGDLRAKELLHDVPEPARVGVS